jgi:hypothetical protein
VTASRRRDNRGVNPSDINPSTLGSNMFVAIPNFLLLSISGYFGVGCGTCAPGHFNVNSWTEADDVDWASPVTGSPIFSWDVTTEAEVRDLRKVARSRWLIARQFLVSIAKTRSGSAGR